MDSGQLGLAQPLSGLDLAVIDDGHNMEIRTSGSANATRVSISSSEKKPVDISVRDFVDALDQASRDYLRSQNMQADHCGYVGADLSSLMLGIKMGFIISGRYSDGKVIMELTSHDHRYPVASAEEENVYSALLSLNDAAYEKFD